jgi:serine/threonine protein kinase/thioredoxin-like negative regulator of GroEL
LEAGSQIGPYLIVGRLGSGGMGDVYRARDQVLDREVAIKTLPPSMRGDRVRLSRFEREARLLASLNHPNIATLHGLEQVGEERFLVMELVEGMSLEILIDAGPMPAAEVLRVSRQIAEALEAAHEKGIVHRDLKPSNVIVGPKGRVKVLDFGIAKSIEPQVSTVLGGGQGNTGLTVPGMVVGTPPYMSPEQVRGLTVDDRSDIWSFACLVYEMLAGRRAYSGETWADTLSAILTQEPDWRALPFEVPDSLRGLLRRCLTRERDRRIARMADVLAELDRIAEEARSGAASQTGSPPTWVEMPRMSPPTLPTLPGLPGLPADFNRPPTAADPTRIRSLVVVPSQVLGGESDRFLADAIPNTVSTHLAQIQGLETKSPPTNLEFERAGRDLQHIAETYQVGAVVLPTVTVAGERLILNLQLVTLPNRVVLWTRDFEDRRDRFIELARAAAEGIRRALRPAAPTLPGVADVVRSSEAELALHQGLFLANLFRRQGLAGDFQRAQSALQRALQLDPRQAEAAAEIARLHAARIMTGVPPQEIVPEVRAWARRALEIDPRSSRAWAVLSEAEQIDPQGSYGSMLEYALKAAAFGPEDGYAHIRLSNALSRRSILLSLQASERARQLDPLELSIRISEALTLIVIGRVEEARARVQEVRRIEPDMPYAVLADALVEAVAGDGDAAVALAAQLEPMAHDGRIRPEWLPLVRDYANLEQAAREGNRELADAAAARLIRLARGEVRFPRWESATSEVAPLLARHGRVQEALDLLLYRHSIGSDENYELLLLSRDLEPLRSDPRFRRLTDPAWTDFEELLGVLAAARERREYPAYLDPALQDLLPLVGVPQPW